MMLLNIYRQFRYDRRSVERAPNPDEDTTHLVETAILEDCGVFVSSPKISRIAMGLWTKPFMTICTGKTLLDGLPGYPEAGTYLSFQAFCSHLPRESGGPL